IATNANVLVNGSVVDDLSGVASLQAALDGGNYAPVNLGSGGTFSFAPGQLADGAHTVRLKATDRAGNVSFLDVPFTLDRVAPSIIVSRPTLPLVTNQPVTVAGTVSDDRSGVASLEKKLDSGTFATVPLSVGAFSFDLGL